MSNLDKLRSLLGPQASALLNGCRRSRPPAFPTPRGASDKSLQRLIESNVSPTTAQFVNDLFGNFSGGSSRRRFGAIQRGGVPGIRATNLIGYTLQGARAGYNAVAGVAGFPSFDSRIAPDLPGASFPASPSYSAGSSPSATYYPSGGDGGPDGAATPDFSANPGNTLEISSLSDY